MRLYRTQTERHMGLRVTFVTPGLQCGGAERWCLTLARNFGPGVKVNGFICGNTKGPLVREAKQIGRVYHQLEALEALAQTDVLIAWGWEHLAEMTKDFEGRIIAVSHGEPGGEWQNKVIAAMARTPRVEMLGVSSRSLDCWPDRGSGIYIPNGVEVDRVTPKYGRDYTREKLGVLPEQRMCLFLGRLSPEKRPWLMHEMLPYLPDNYVSVLCGPDMAGYTAGLRGKDRVIVVPPVDRPGDMLAAADVFVLPSETEAHPLALTEAWVAGVPTVYCDWPFAEQIRKDYICNLGRVAPVDCGGETLADKVFALTRSSAMFAKDIAWQDFTASAMAGRWEEYIGINKPAVEHGQSLLHC